jgi:hypothetical protein
MVAFLKLSLETGSSSCGVRRRTPMRPRVPGAILMLAAISLLLLLSACSSWWDSESDAVRRAVIAYELDEPGIRVDDLVIRLSPSEFRADFGHQSRMVWLVSNALERQYREGEYFRLRDPERSYLFVQEVRYSDSAQVAMVRVVLHLVSQPLVTKDLTLHKTDAAWEVVSERLVQ